MCADSQSLLDELLHWCVKFSCDETCVDLIGNSVQAAVGVLKCLLYDPYVLPGAGCIERMLAQHLKTKAYIFRVTLSCANTASRSKPFPHPQL